MIRALALTLAVTAALAPALAPVWAGAETYADAYGLGDHPAQPATGAGLGSIAHVSARLEKADGRPADHVRGREIVHLRLEVARAMDRASVTLDLTCRAVFTDADNKDSPAAEGDCFRGRLAPGLPVPLDLALAFRGNPDDPPATYGVEVTVKDRISGETVQIMPTWGWEGAE